MQSPMSNWRCSEDENISALRLILTTNLHRTPEAYIDLMETGVNELEPILLSCRFRDPQCAGVTTFPHYTWITTASPPFV
jgi:hypothetical protein